MLDVMLVLIIRFKLPKHKSISQVFDMISTGFSVIFRPNNKRKPSNIEYKSMSTYIYTYIYYSWCLPNYEMHCLIPTKSVSNNKKQKPKKKK